MPEKTTLPHLYVIHHWCPKIDYSVGLVLPGECEELKKDIQSIFEEEMEKHANFSFKDCFSHSKISALFKNEKKN